MQSARAPRSRRSHAAEQPGWIFEVDDWEAAGPTTAEILEVLQVPGYRAYRVRWQNGSESTLLPSSGHRAHPPTAAER